MQTSLTNVRGYFTLSRDVGRKKLDKISLGLVPFFRHELAITNPVTALAFVVDFSINIAQSLERIDSDTTNLYTANSSRPTI